MVATFHRRGHTACGILPTARTRELPRRQFSTLWLRKLPTATAPKITFCELKHPQYAVLQIFITLFASCFASLVMTHYCTTRVIAVLSPSNCRKFLRPTYLSYSCIDSPYCLAWLYNNCTAVSIYKICAYFVARGVLSLHAQQTVGT